MNYNSIKELLEKFYSGETSLEEEATLKRFFAEEIVPERLRADQELFRSLTALEEESILDEDFDKAVLAQMEFKSHKWRRREWIYTLSSLAAAAIIVISLWIGGTFSHQQQLPGTVNSPQVAYEQTKKALMEVSANLNKGLVPVQRATEKFDEPVQQMSKMGNMEQVISNVKYLGEINRAKEIILSINGVYINL